MATVKARIKPLTITPQEEVKKETPVNNKAKITKLVNDLNKKFGVNAVSYGVPKDNNGNIKVIERLPTGSFTLDIALGGGLPLGRYIELSGELSATKTTQVLHTIKNAQKMGLQCAMSDVENTTTEEYMNSLGVDANNVIYTNPDGAEEALQGLNDFQKSGIVHLGVLDSIASLCPTKEQDSGMDESVQMGLIQKLLGEFFRKFQAANNRLVREGKKPFTVIAINQIREKIGVTYGDSTYTPGGRAKGFTASVDIRLRRGDWITEGKGKNKEIVGQVVKFKIEKNKTFKRMQTGEFDFYFAPNSAGVPVGFNDTVKEVIMCAVEWGVIQRGGAWYLYKDLKYQGVAPLIEALRSNETLIEEIKAEVLKIASTFSKRDFADEEESEDEDSED